MDHAQEEGVRPTVASAESLELEADDMTPKSVRALDEKGETIEIPATGIVLTAGRWTTRLASKLLGKRVGAALDTEPRFVTPQIAGAQHLSFSTINPHHLACSLDRTHPAFR